MEYGHPSWFGFSDGSWPPSRPHRLLRCYLLLAPAYCSLCFQHQREREREHMMCVCALLYTCSTVPIKGFLPITSALRTEHLCSLGSRPASKAETITKELQLRPRQCPSCGTASMFLVDQTGLSKLSVLA